MSKEEEYSNDVPELWRHPNPEKTQLYAFLQHVKEKHGLQGNTYNDLWKWSIQHPGAFWEEIWHYTGIKARTPYESVLNDNSPMFPKPTFFPGCTLNFAENLLYPAANPNPESLAIKAATESTREDVTWKELRERTRVCAAAMEAVGVKVGDRVAGYLGNHSNTVVAMLAATSLGALWTGISPDTGVSAVLDRLRQVEPVLLFADNAVAYNGKTHPTHGKITEVVSELPSLRNVVIFDTIPGHAFNLEAISPKKETEVQSYSTFTSKGKSSRELSFLALPPDHPVYILYSSGTTGAPKPIVHGALGMLLQHKKEHALQSDVRPGERVFYFTTCTWMMWHWLVSGLASGATIVLYDGSPFQPHKEMSMPLLIDELEIDHFGTSAKYLSVLEQASVVPASASPKSATLKSLKSIFSTGSPLAPSTFQYVYKSLNKNVLLGSITGGTDIVSLFGAPCPLLPVHAGEIQCRGLGMAVATYLESDDANSNQGKDITGTGQPGELVCTVPFPCQPVMFWPPGEKGLTRYRDSYFATFTHASDSSKPIWHHGDFIRINPTTGGIWMLGRSDGVLNPLGVRFGSSEIYNVLLKHFSNEIEDALCIGRKRDSDVDEQVILFIKLSSDNSNSNSNNKLDNSLTDKIKATVRKELSARHVPSKIDQTPEIPYTMNGKKVEGAVKKILCGRRDVKISASVSNPDCLEFYREWSERN